MNFHIISLICSPPERLKYLLHHSTCMLTMMEVAYHDGAHHNAMMEVAYHDGAHHNAMMEVSYHDGAHHYAMMEVAYHAGHPGVR